MKAVVVGATGFIGRALCSRLLKKNYDVIAVIRSRHGKCFIQHDRLRVVYSDASQFEKLDDLIEDRNIDVFYYLAWTGSSGELRGDYKVQIGNISAAVDAMYACGRMECERFVFAASIMEYEIEEQNKADKKFGIKSLYAIAKLSTDYMLKAVAQDRGITYIRAVISNIYGPGENSERLVNTSIRKMLRGEKCSFSSGYQMYDFIYIDDAVDSFIAIGEFGRNKTYYVGSFNPAPLRTFLLKIRDMINKDLDIGLGDLPFEGVSLNYYDEFDINAIYDDTGFLPQVSFEEGIKKTVNWIKGEEGL